jgi:hypothetical protein
MPKGTVVCVYRMSSSVCDLGTIKSIIRGINEPHPHALLCEMIDDAEHSNSSKVFIDINTHDKCVVFGFENAATEDQLTKMVQWNPVSTDHSTSHISTCGQGMKFYTFRFRGEQINATKTLDPTTGKYIYTTSKLNSHIIYKAAGDPDVSETKFSEILNRNTHYVERSDEIISSIANIFNDTDNKYPFKPYTVILSKNITNTTLLDWLTEVDDKGKHININNLEKEMINKYFAEIKNGSLTVYIKFPNDTTFRELGANAHVDIIGTTLDHIDEHIIDIFHIENDFDSLKKGEYVIRIHNVFFSIKKSGNTYYRSFVSIEKSNYSNMFQAFSFTQYTFIKPTKDEEAIIKSSIVGTAMDDYCGIYLKIGNKFIDGKPISCGITKRNLPGAKFYRGILDMKTPEKTKMLLGIQGLKSNFNLSSMQQLDLVIKQCCIIYSNFYKKYPDYHSNFKMVDPRQYCEVKTTNEKTKKTSIPGYLYLRLIGKNFYKLGMTRDSNKMSRIFDKQTEADMNTLITSFPEEEIYRADKQYYEYLSPEFNAVNSSEQALKEYIIELSDVVMYDNKVGDGIREYFHCDSKDTLHDIRQFMINCLDTST